MAAPILATKLFIPPPRPNVVPRPRLIERLNESLCQNQDSGNKLTLISAPAGFGKTTLISEWINQKDEDGKEHRRGAAGSVSGRMKDEKAGEGSLFHPSSFRLHSCKVAWLSLDEGDKDPTRFLTYLIAALQTVAANLGEGMLPVLQSPQPPPVDLLLTTLINEITAIQQNFILVLDDYHVVDSRQIDHALGFLIARLPPQMHLVIATREDPSLPLARLRARGQLTELRAADLRFTPAEAAGFLNQVMGLNLGPGDIEALERRTEGWIAGLQLAALALQGLSLQETISRQGSQDIAGFIQSFTGSHHFVMDYLVEEVLQQQPEPVQSFLLRTSILERMCGPLCDALPVGKLEGLQVEKMPLTFEPSNLITGQQILEYLERANLFVVPLDTERRWYRYHHLFAEILRQRLQQSINASPADAHSRMNELHIRASQWLEDNGYEFEAFQHAAAANDIDRAERLIEGKGIPLHARGAVTTILDWLESLPVSVLDARPSMWWRYASILLISGQRTGVEEKLQAAEAALAANAGSGTSARQISGVDEKTRNLIGQIATARATVALTRYDVEAMLIQSRRALEYLHPSSLSTRANAYWTMGFAYLLDGDRESSRRALSEALSLSHASGAIFTTILATIGLGNLQEADNQLRQAAETYRLVLQMTGDQPLTIIYEAHLGLARILYEWNDLDAAEQHGRQSLQLAQQYEAGIDRYIICMVMLARLKMAKGDLADASAILAQASQSARQQNFVYRIPEVAAAQILLLLRQGNLMEASRLAQAYNLPTSRARVILDQGDASAALTALEPWRQQVEARGWADERLRVMVLQALALQAHGETDKAVQLLGEALALAEPEAFIRTFIDEGEPMKELLSSTLAQVEAHDSKNATSHASGEIIEYLHKLLSVFENQKAQADFHPSSLILHPYEAPLSQREIEILRLIAQGLSNQEISERLFLALSTVKGHNRIIFDKLQVQRRTEAIARARELGLI